VTDGQTDRQTDGQTEFSSLDRVCIACSAVKMMEYYCTYVQIYFLLFSYQFTLKRKSKISLIRVVG